MAKSRSFQNEIPPSRVNIRYVKKTDGAQEKVELPLKLLLLGDYTMRPEDVMREQKLKLKMTVPNHLSGAKDDEMSVDLDVDSLKAFTPDEVVRRVPELAKMIEIRELLSDLKARVITNRNFRQALEKIVKDKDQLAAITKELDNIAPLPDVVSGKAGEE
jgi:type VI secretion system protein ImpB